MEAQELRIGNYVNLYIESGLDLIPSKGDIIKCNDLILIEREDIMAEPIPLNEEWLLNFGFTRQSGWDDMVFYEKDEVQIECDCYGFEFVNELSKEIKYVHQLQNLYFALIGKELKLKTE